VVEALVARGQDVIGNQNGRDIGVQLSGNLFLKDDFSLVDYAFGVFNGAGINKLDTNEQKDFIGRVVVHPWKDLSVGGSYYNGRYTLTSSPTLRGERDRVGAEFAYLKDRLSLRGEFISGLDGSIKKRGWYLQGGYFLIPKKLQGVFKFDTFDPNEQIDNNETNVYTFGANWYFNKWAFIQLNYELKDEIGRKEIDNNIFTTQLTLQF
jgi:hypothetical protein